MPYADDARDAAYHAEYRERHRLRHTAYMRSYREANKEKLRAQARERYKRTRDQRHAYELRSRYGLSRVAWAALLEQQGGRCAVCRGEFQKRPNVDHDHDTGLVRGLLCTGCNRALGFMGDDPERLEAAAAYLRRSRRLSA